MIQSSRLLCSGAMGEVCKEGIYSQIPENMVRNIMYFGYDTICQIWAHAVEAQGQTPAVFMRDCYSGDETNCCSLKVMLGCRNGSDNLRHISLCNLFINLTLALCRTVKLCRLLSCMSFLCR